ncbi:MAG: hypothetical protein ABJE10_11710 [bacterium]
MSRFARVAIVFLLALGNPLGAQQSVGSARSLPERLSAESRATIERVVDSARTAGLPTEPIYDKVLEGVLKGATDQRIVLAVQSLVRELGSARAVLGGANNPSLLGATASALHAGVSATDLRRLVHPSGDVFGDPAVLTSALVVLVDIVAKRVPPGVAVSAIGDLLHRGAPERQFVALRSEIEQDIIAGRPPESALLERTRAHLRLLDADPLTSNPASRRPTLPPHEAAPLIQ